MTSETSVENPEPTTPSLADQTWWHKSLIWGTFFVLLYLLREFFLIGFLTFLFCFVIRSAVGLLEKRLAAGRDNHRLDLVLTLVVFLGVCLALYGPGRYFVPKLVRQGRSLVTRTQNSSAKEVQKRRCPIPSAAENLKTSLASRMTRGTRRCCASFRLPVEMARAYTTSSPSSTRPSKPNSR